MCTRNTTGECATMADGDEPRASRPEAPAIYGFSKETAGRLPWSHATERLERARTYWLATTRPDGRPHVTPIWGVWVGGALYFDGLPTTRWARNLAANPAIAIHLESGEDVVILEGAAEEVTTDEETAAAIVRAWDGKYGRLHPEPATRGVFRLRPRAARAWSRASLEDGTRWRFGDA